MKLTYSACLALALALSIVACQPADEPVAHSAPVGIHLKAKAGDVFNGTVSDEKTITSESSNPFGKFIADAREKLGGADPARIRLSNLTLSVEPDPRGVADLHDVFDDRVSVMFQMNDSQATYFAGHIDLSLVAAQAGPVRLAIDFDSDEFQGDDWERLLDGNFKVVIAGRAADGFETTGAEADLQLTFSFQAFAPKQGEETTEPDPNAN